MSQHLLATLVTLCAALPASAVPALPLLQDPDQPMPASAIALSMLLMLACGAYRRRHSSQYSFPAKTAMESPTGSSCVQSKQGASRPCNSSRLVPNGGPLGCES